ncbi:hypothetical protein C1645_794822 [Glomus cerebriforme]|uniref:Uncharacterized protein n=1 Tax=Glomus cerebriforme TaxID=658196 RepID=A0A397S8U0_9GLOM|nr:hypothetical protein C1645_794822 [Glomus cerebriforme]
MILYIIFLFYVIIWLIYDYYSHVFVCLFFILFFCIFYIFIFFPIVFVFLYVREY